MPVGTVRGRYELDAPALRTLKDLEKQGIKTQAQFKAVAEQIDKIGDRKDQEQLVKYREVSRRMTQSLRQQWTLTANHIEREVGKSNRALDGLIARMEVVGSVTMRPEIDLSGVSGALTQLELVQRRMGALNREVARPRVGLSGGLGRGAAGGALRAGGGAVGGFSGGGGRGLRSVGLGPLNFGSAAGIGLMGAALPAATSLGGAAIGLGSSVGMGALALGSLAPAGAGGLAAGLGSLVAIAKPAAAGIKLARQEMIDYSQAVADFGRKSTQARNAKRELDQAMSAAPRGTRDLLRDWDSFRTMWRRETAPGRDAFVGAARSGVGALRRATPWASQQVNLNAQAGARSADNLFGFLSGAQGRRGFTTGSEIFRGNLPAVEQGAENVLATWTNLMQAAKPFFRESTGWLQKWTRGWRTGTDDVDATRRKIAEMERHLKGAARFGSALWDVLKTMGGASAPEGLRLMDHMTAQLRVWEDQMKRNPAATRAFFRNSVNSTLELGRAAKALVRELGNLSEILRPILDRFSQLVTLAGSLGMLQPGALSLGLGAYRGFRGRGPGRGSAGSQLGGAGGGGGGGAVVPIMGGGFGAGGGVRGMLRGAGGMYGRGGILGAPMSAARGMAGTYGVARGFGYGRAASAGAALGGTGLAGGIGAAARGAGRAFWPVALGMGALDFFSFQGNIGQKTQAAVSGATLGIIPRPRTKTELDDAAAQYAQKSIGSLSGGRTLGALRGDISGLRRARGTIGGDDAIDLGTGEDRTRRIQQIKAAFNQEIAVRKQMAHEINQVRNESSRQRAGRIQRDLGRAYDIRAANKGPEAAMQYTVGRVLDIQRGMRGAGAKVLSQNTLAWAHAQARANPALLDEYKHLREGVMRNFSRTHRNVVIVNDQIFKDTKSAWAHIRKTITSEAERARQEATDSLTRLQREALRGLMDMGWSRREARSLINNQERGGGAAGSATNVARAPHPGAPFSKGGSGVTPIGSQPKQARGGRLRGWGRQDNVQLASGGLGAPGEVVLTTHQENYLNRLLSSAGAGTSVEDVTKRVTQRHADPPPVGSRVRGYGRGHRSPPGFQRGGIVPIPWAPGERTNSSILGLITRLHNRFGTYVSDSYGPGHQSPGHTRFGTAVDWIPGSTGWDGVDALVAWAVKAGYKTLYDGRFGSTAYPDHGRGNHAHIEFGGGGGGRGVPMGGFAGGGQHINLHRRFARTRGIPGAMAQTAMDAQRRGLERKINRQIGGGGGGFSGGGLVGGNAAANMRAGHRMMLQRWGEDQWPALRELWMRESGWRNVMNTAGSGATGIPQALPGSKMASAGADWRTNPVTQMKWGLGYIASRYGSPSAALAFHHSHNWYQRGGRIAYAGAFAGGGEFSTNGPTMFMAGEHGRERVRVARDRGGIGRGGLGRANFRGMFEGATFNVRHDGDIEKIAEAVSGKILKALD